MMTPKEKLLLLATKLEADAANPKGMKFDLANWFDAESIMKLEKDMVRPTPDCGTTGCAIGLAMITPEFLEEGFAAGMRRYPDYNGDTGWEALESYFGVEYNDAIRLFMDDQYPKDLRKGAEAERAVAQRIREYVAGRYM